MATIKSHTDIEQSKKLAEILPTKSADMYYDDIVDNVTGELFIPNDGSTIKLGKGHSGSIAAWSLASLLEQLPYEVCDDDGNSVYLQMSKEDDVYQLVYEDPHGDFENIETDRHEHFVDACVAMILNLNELNVL